MEKTYYKHKIENLLNISKIVAVRYFELDKDFVGQYETHDFWEMVYADRSNAVCVANESETLLKEGEALFHKPGEPHYLRSDGKRALNVFVVMFECRNEAVRFFDDRKIKIDRSNLSLIYSIIEESKNTFELSSLDPYQKKLELLPSPSLGGKQIIKNYLEILLINLIRSESKKNSSSDVFLFRDEFNERISGMVIEYMNENIGKKLSVTEICEAMHYSKSYLFKEFKNAVGYPMMTYFTKLKIDHAKRMLRETYMSVSEISEALAFDNPNYFSKTFKRMTGHTPSKYREIRKHVSKSEP